MSSDESSCSAKTRNAVASEGEAAVLDRAGTRGRTSAERASGMSVVRPSSDAKRSHSSGESQRRDSRRDGTYSVGNGAMSV